MAVNFTLKEPISTNKVPNKPFGLYDDGAPIHEILRILVGSVDVFNKKTGRITKLRKDQLRVFSKSLISPEHIVKKIFDSSISVGEYGDFLSRTKSRNEAFYCTLRQDIILCIVSKEAGRNTEAFLYLYRILEFISVTFPLLYATIQTDFRKSHAFLQSLLKNDRDGDLKAFERFIPTLSQNGNLNRLTFDFSVAGKSEDFVSALKIQLDKSVRGSVRGFEFDDSGDILFRVPFNSVHSLLVNVRNRMFHNRVGEENIDLGQIGGSEDVCEIIMNECMYWISLIYTEIVRVLVRGEI